MAVQQLAPLILSDDERAELKSLTMRRKTAQALALRARIVLTCAEGGQNKEVAAKLGLDRATVGKWRRRFVERRVDGLHDEPRSGAPRTIDDARIEAVIVRTLESCPENATHWSSRGMAKASGLSVCRRCNVSGGPSASSRTGWRRSSSRPIQTSWPKCATSWAFTSRHRTFSEPIGTSRANFGRAHWISLVHDWSGASTSGERTTVPSRIKASWLSLMVPQPDSCAAAMLVHSITLSARARVLAVR